MFIKQIGMITTISAGTMCPVNHIYLFKTQTDVYVRKQNKTVTPSKHSYHTSS